MHTTIDCFHSCGQHLCKFLGTKEALKKADVASYINDLFVTISFIQTGQKVILKTINSKQAIQ